MTAQSIVRLRAVLFATLLLLGSLLAAPVARADSQSGTLSVNASVVSTLSMTITDNTVNFGSNLSALAPASNSTDTVWNTPLGPRVYYQWRPTPSGQPSTMATVTSSIPWQIYSSIPESTGSSLDVRVSQGDLRVSGGAYCDQPVTVSQADGFLGFLASTSQLVWNSPSGGMNAPVDMCLFLRVEAADDPGSFASILTLTVTN